MISFLRNLMASWNFSKPVITFFIALFKIIFLVLIVLITKWLLLEVTKRYFYYKSKKDRILYDRREKTIENIINSLLSYLSVPIIIIGTLTIVGIDAITLLTGAGLIGVAFGFGFQDLLKDMVAGMFIVIEKVFSVGDYVKINDQIGTIKQIGIKSTTMQTRTGELYIISNREISEAFNYSNTNYIVCYNKFSLRIDENFDSVLEKLTQDLRKIKEKYPNEVLENPSVNGIEEINNDEASIEIETKVKPMKQFLINRVICTEILNFLKENKINIPYPTYKVLTEKSR